MLAHPSQQFCRAYVFALGLGNDVIIRGEEELHDNIIKKDEKAIVAAVEADDDLVGTGLSRYLLLYNSSLVFVAGAAAGAAGPGTGGPAVGAAAGAAGARALHRPGHCNHAGNGQ